MTLNTVPLRETHFSNYSKVSTFIPRSVLVALWNLVFFLLGKHDCFAAKIEPTFIVNLKKLYVKNVTDLHEIGDFFDSFQVKLRDVDQSLFAGEDFNEGDEVHNLLHSCFVRLSNFRHFGDSSDHRACFFACLF